MSVSNGSAALSTGVVRSMLDATSISEAVAKQFSVAPVDDCFLLRRGFNDVYELRLASGERLVARLSALRSRGDANIEYELSMLVHLRVGGAAVAAPRRTQTGKLAARVLAPEGSRALALFDYLDGEPPRDDAENVRLMGAELARIHAIGKAYTGPASRYSLDANHLISKPLGRILALRHLDTSLKDDFTKAAASLESYVRGAALTSVACHGDCHGGNAFVKIDDDGSRRAWFFDFDDSGPGYQAYDLAVYLWARLLQGNLTEPDDKVQPIWEAFLDGYRSVACIADSDLDAMYAFVAIRQLWLMGEYAGHVTDVGTQNLPNDWFRSMLERLDKWRMVFADK